LEASGFQSLCSLVQLIRGCLIATTPRNADVVQPGRTRRRHRRGQGFKSLLPLPYLYGGRDSESDPPESWAPLRSSDPGVIRGSTPWLPTLFASSDMETAVVVELVDTPARGAGWRRRQCWFESGRRHHVVSRGRAPCHDPRLATATGVTLAGLVARSRLMRFWRNW
jgi:hypothetical protein